MRLPGNDGMIVSWRDLGSAPRKNAGSTHWSASMAHARLWRGFRRQPCSEPAAHEPGSPGPPPFAGWSRAAPAGRWDWSAQQQPATRRRASSGHQQDPVPASDPWAAWPSACETGGAPPRWGAPGARRSSASGHREAGPRSRRTCPPRDALCLRASRPEPGAHGFRPDPWPTC